MPLFDHRDSGQSSKNGGILDYRQSCTICPSHVSDYWFRRLSLDLNRAVWLLNRDHHLPGLIPLPDVRSTPEEPGSTPSSTRTQIHTGISAESRRAQVTGADRGLLGCGFTRISTSSKVLTRDSALSALYHAAQVGIAARVKEPTARGYLSPLLTLLENLKKEIGPNDAVDNDAVAAAYVENFGLKVFGMTDSEDRAGKATRGTAKRFLVAANLLELLQVFDKANVSDSVRCPPYARCMTSPG